MEHFVTYFNISYIPQGLCLHDSMQKKIGDFVLWILCLDDETHELLEKKQLEGVNLLKLSEWENNRLLSVKNSRTFTEYCWTLTPYTPKIVFESDRTINRVTYIDADICFLQCPQCIFDEFDKSGKDVYITDHAYSPECDQSYLSGRYCVQFVIFNREGGEIVRQHWEDCCIEYCNSEPQDGKFGDQKYLDEWPVRFSEQVHVAKQKEWFLAPWNATRFPYSDGIIWHFHGFHIGTNYMTLYKNYKIPKVVLEYIYKPYYNKAIEFYKNNHVDKFDHRFFKVYNGIFFVLYNIYSYIKKNSFLRYNIKRIRGRFNRF